MTTLNASQIARKLIMKMLRPYRLKYDCGPGGTIQNVIDPYRNRRLGVRRNQPHEIREFAAKSYD